MVLPCWAIAVAPFSLLNRATITGKLPSCPACLTLLACEVLYTSDELDWFSRLRGCRERASRVLQGYDVAAANRRHHQQRTLCNVWSFCSYLSGSCASYHFAASADAPRVRTRWRVRHSAYLRQSGVESAPERREPWQIDHERTFSGVRAMPAADIS